MSVLGVSRSDTHHGSLLHVRIYPLWAETSPRVLALQWEERKARIQSPVEKLLSRQNLTKKKISVGPNYTIWSRVTLIGLAGFAPVTRRYVEHDRACLHLTADLS